VIVVLIGLVALGYKLLNHGHASGSAGNRPTATQSVTVPPLSAPGVVRAYYAAINQHHYRRAWQLGGKNSGGSFSAYEHGFAGTKHDAVRIMGHSGDIVRVKIFAKQTDGTRKVYQGFYRVAHGAIVYSHIYRIIFK